MIDLTASPQPKEEYLQHADLLGLLTPSPPSLRQPKALAPATPENAQIDPKLGGVDGNAPWPNASVAVEEKEEEEYPEEEGEEEESTAAKSVVNVVHHMMCSNCDSSKQDQCEGPPGRPCNRCHKLKRGCEYTTRTRRGRASTKGWVLISRSARFRCLLSHRSVKSKNYRAPGRCSKRKRSGEDEKRGEK